MAAIRLIGVEKTYPGGVSALQGIDLDIEDGELLVLVGPSGCGKSTLLRVIAGLEEATGGNVMIGGRDVTGKEPAERDIAMVFQNYALYPHMTVRQNLEYGLRNLRTPRPEIDRRVAEAARVLEIGQLLERRPRQLSGGQRQRVAMGRAIVRQPKVYLFDEPLSNLDAKLRGQMRVEIRRLQRSLATTSVYVTHDQLEAMTLADRLVVMNAGRIEQVGTPADLFDRPASLFVAGFIGTPPMNLIPIADLRAAGAAIEGAPAGCVAGIRPDAIGLVPQGRDCLAIPAAVDLVERVGAMTHVHASAGNVALVAEVPTSLAPRDGERTLLHFSASQLHLFDGATGRRVAGRVMADPDHIVRHHSTSANAVGTG